MASFFALIFFIFHFCVLICLSTAGWLKESLPTNPYKMLEKCYQLTQLPEFKEMIKKLGDQPIPIEKGEGNAAVWNDEGQVNYPEFLYAIKSWNKANQQISGRLPFPAETKVLQENCCTKKSCFWFLNGKVTVQEMLTAALECADRVHEYALKEMAMPIPKEKKGGYEKLPKEWTQLDEKFAAEFQKIWMIKELDSFYYDECHRMSESPKFSKIIGILEDKVAVVKGAIWDDEGPVNYPNLLSATERFLKEWDEKRKFIDKISLDSKDKPREWERTDEYAKFKSANEFFKTKSLFKKFLEEQIFTRQGNVYKCETVEELLNKTLQCAVAVHQHTQHILALKKGSNKETRNMEFYTKLDKKFETELSKIWGLKPEKMI